MVQCVMLMTVDKSIAEKLNLQIFVCRHIHPKTETLIHLHFTRPHYTDESLTSSVNNSVPLVCQC